MFFRKNKKNNVQNTSIRELDKSDNKINAQLEKIKSQL